MENKQKIYRVDIIEWQDAAGAPNGRKDLVFSLTPDGEEVFWREATEADLKWHKRKLEFEAAADAGVEEPVYGLF
tara:strand:+ start:608 stop:832 length:225 start_codon:yes stop_codon:yes gene_type:complete